jgi:hypothetical protein
MAESGAALMAELEAAHAALLERIVELGQVTDAPQPSRLEITAARMRLSQSSIERRSILNRALRHLAARGDEAATRAVEKVREADGELIAHSVTHLGKWTAEAVAQDWTGYCAASKSMREHMAETVRAEAETLRPHLK